MFCSFVALKFYGFIDNITEFVLVFLSATFVGSVMLAPLLSVTVKATV